MTLMQIVHELEEILNRIDACTDACYAIEIDYDYLSSANEVLTVQIAVIKQTLAYKMEQFEAYGEPLDEMGIDNLRELIEEIGYDQVQLLFGDSVTTALSEAAAEEAIYRV